ncbi:hypothetical protein [Allosphingosinicella sp.]|jgi:hypothetical protein|uniref:hypothetical protein n=1 Tax=Allosphingosinicella sp. TaxID=2823234 RepID=UPI002F02C92C
MSPSKFSPILAALLLLPAACGGGEPEADPAAIDNHLNQILAREEADREKLVAEARIREAVRESEMEQDAVNYSNNRANAAD